MVGSFDQYRKHARDCFAMAQSASDERTKANLFAMAQAWMRLAEQAAKNGLSDPVYGTHRERGRSADFKFCIPVRNEKRM